MFPAKSGDCFYIEFTEEDFRILIDGGYVETYYNSLRPFLKELNSKGKHLNLMIISHIDQDHINGIKTLLLENGTAIKPKIISIDEVWFNGFKHTDTIRENKKIPFYEKNVLQMMANQNDLPHNEEGIHNISFSQGQSVAELLTKNNYNWNTSVNGNTICTDVYNQIKFGNISLHILNPTQTILNNLAENWIQYLKAKCNSVVITDNHIFDDAFEGSYINEHEEWVTVVKEISNNSAVPAYDWKSLALQPDDNVDTKLANCASIAILISYNNMNLLFPGDCPIESFKENLPNKIDIVKLPHHGSGKNVSKEFVQYTDVEYYLISTDGKHFGHPSPVIIASILTKTHGKSHIIKNYDIPLLNGIGKLESDINE